MVETVRDMANVLQFYNESNPTDEEIRLVEYLCCILQKCSDGNYDYEECTEGTLDIEEHDTDIVDDVDHAVECLLSDQAHSSPKSEPADTVESLYSMSLPAKKSRSSKQVSHK